MDSLLRLPEGAAYRRSNERAHVEASRKGGVIYITGTCDSLQRQVEYYEALYHNARDALDSYHEAVKQEEKERADPAKTFSTGLALGYVVGILFVIFIINLKRQKDE